jgi:hypothetical protein
VRCPDVEDGEVRIVFIALGFVSFTSYFAQFKQLCEDIGVRASSLFSSTCRINLWFSALPSGFTKSFSSSISLENAKSSSEDVLAESDEWRREKIVDAADERDEEQRRMKDILEDAAIEKDVDCFRNHGLVMSFSSY